MILIGHGQMDAAEAREPQPRVVLLDADDRIVGTGSDPAETNGSALLTRGDIILG